MNSNSENRTRKRVWTCVAVLLLFALSLPLVSGAGEADICKRAMLNCLRDTLLSAPAGQLAWFLALEFCFIGHEFCRKYVIPML